MIRIWNAEGLRHLYHDKKMTLREIAPIYSVSCEAIRLVMKRLNVPTDRHRKPKPSGPRFSGLSDYLARGKDCRATMRRYLPKEARQCAECGSTRFIILHHIVYPAKSLEDIQILCRSCHKMKHDGKMSYLKQLDLYIDYKSGLKHKALMLKYDISHDTIDKVIHKIKNGLRTYRG